MLDVVNFDQCVIIIKFQVVENFKKNAAKSNMIANSRKEGGTNCFLWVNVCAHTCLGQEERACTVNTINSHGIIVLLFTSFGKSERPNVKFIINTGFHFSIKTKVKILTEKGKPRLCRLTSHLNIGMWSLLVFQQIYQKFSCFPARYLSRLKCIAFSNKNAAAQNCILSLNQLCWKKENLDQNFLANWEWILNTF